MHGFVLCHFLFDLPGEYTVIERISRRGSVAVALLQFAVRFIIVQFLMENFQSRLQLLVFALLLEHGLLFNMVFCPRTLSNSLARICYLFWRSICASETRIAADVRARH